MNKRDAKSGQGDDPSSAPESGDAKATGRGAGNRPQSSGDPATGDRSERKTGDAPESGTRDTKPRP
jgi:hypothetical protein